MLSAARARFGAVLFAGVAFAAAAGASTFGMQVGTVGGDTLNVDLDIVEISPGVFTATGTAGAPEVFTLNVDLHLEGDPMISGSFTLINLSGITQTFSVSATLGGVVLPGPTLMGGSVGDIVYTDLSGDGLVTLATVGGSFFYQAQIDGASVQDLGQFSVGPTSGVVPRLEFGTPIPSAVGPGVTTSIGVAFPAFSLTAGDQVMTPFEFVVVVPEPASAPLLALGLVALAVRSRRRA
jgi:hypothetical protein